MVAHVVAGVELSAREGDGKERERGTASRHDLRSPDWDPLARGFVLLVGVPARAGRAL